MEKSIVAKFRVSYNEIWQRTFIVEASDEEAAINFLCEGNDGDDETFEYNRTDDYSFMAERIDEEPTPTTPPTPSEEERIRLEREAYAAQEEEDFLKYGWDYEERRSLTAEDFMPHPADRCLYDRGYEPHHSR